MVSRKLAIKGEPNVRLKSSRNFHFSLVFSMKNTRTTTTPSPFSPPPCVHSKHPRVCRHHAHMLKTNVCVVPVHTGFFNVSHTTYHTPHHTPPRPPHHTETETDRHRDRQTEREEETKEREREREKKRKRERKKTRQQKREERRFIFSVVVHGHSLLMECFFWKIPFAREESLVC